MKIYFIIFDKVEELDLVGSWELIGLLAEMKLCEPPKLISLNSMSPSGEHGMRFSADIHFSENIFPDVLIVPGGSGARLAMEDPDVIEYLQQTSSQSHSILSICTGMYLLQKSGILTNKRATTHWAFLDELKQDNSVEIIEERYVKDGNVWSSAGVSAGMDMTLAFIADCFGETVASEIQLNAEYFPSPKIYGDAAVSNPQVSQYIKQIVG
ncbi:DJ-1/PfpI family protein [Reinekea sp. G2M2-21]|uniref:DJ-1/PfpI family protein n=1 Tax=Reinekea sp. G2M2-21 TaxID=2788942 RepID=UPI001E62654A|nr:DJ-1/PfpI family protein [Reinekea sp. G2M2-21]